MTHYKRTHHRPCLTSAVLLLCSLCSPLFPVSTAHAASSWRDIQFGGFASQGYLHSSNNDYLGDTSEGTFDFREYAVNASWSYGPWRLGAQVFGQKLGDYGDDKIQLDWASVDYQPAQWFGVRAGRVKLPRGLYNEALDLDSVRPFVLLPQSVYDARLRDFSAAFNGGMVFGNVDVHKYGSIDYKFYGGEIPIDLDSGANDYFNQDAAIPNTRIGMDYAYGTSLFWNTPVNGLRAGYSYSNFRNFGADRAVNMPPFGAINVFRIAPHYQRHLASVEYVTGDWTFAAEAGVDRAIYYVGLIGTPPSVSQETKSRYAYISAARRLNEKWEIGAYYSYSKETTVDRANGPTTFPMLKQNDYALSVRYDFNAHLLLKVEVHYMDGAGKIFDLPAKPQPVADRDESWTLIAAKMTYTF
jgi:predicted porin